MKKHEELKKKLSYKRKNFWESSTKKEQRVAFKFAEKYKEFLDECKTVRESVNYVEKLLEEKNFTNIDSSTKGKKIFKTGYGKNIAFAVIGKKPISEGVNIVAAHVDAPRVDLKQMPLQEDSQTKLGIMRTHYYGGVKKYQWMSTPLAIHGVIIKQSGEIINVSIGEDEKDPIFIMPDLLPHLAAKEQYAHKMGDAIKASQMKVLFNSIPYMDKDEEISEAVKLNALIMLNEKYDITEEDFLRAELELVPAGKSRDAGLDKSFVAGYGQDDRICAYTGMKALLDCDLPEKTAIVFLTDKEEVGSEGNTGANAIFLTDFIGDLLKYNKEDSDSFTLRKTMINSQIISADVAAAINPNYPNVHEPSNAVHLGFGVGLIKYTGSRGKSSANDANAEFVAKMTNIFNDDKVNWQMGTLGKVDEGGGGTIAKFLAESGAEVIDCGPGLLGMHSLYELCSKADLYSTYRAYKAFFVKG